MFIIGGNQDVCPRGFICINNYNLLIILIIIVVGIYLLNKQVYLSLYNKMLLKQMNNEEVNSEDIYGVTNPPAIEISKDGIDEGYGYDEQKHGAKLEYPFNNSTRGNKNKQNTMQNQNQSSQLVDMDRVMLNDRLYPPLSRNHYLDETGIQRRPVMGVPINVETRGSGGDFQQVGILSKQVIEEDTKVPGNNTDSNILPLYGKPTYRGSSRWLYYTETDKFNPIKIPISVNNRDCTDDQGCDELFDGSEVVIPSYNGKFTVKIYKFNKPRYIPIENPKEMLPLPFT
jgi:hypothetical protein